MEDFLQQIRTGLDAAGELTETVLNAISLLFIVLGAILSLRKSIATRLHLAADHPRHTYFRLLFSGWLVVALEFQLAADIVATIVSPTTETLILLGAVAVIRTFLNYFLTREMKEQAEIVQRDRQQSGPDRE